ncbi:gliding motility protein GldC [Pseudopedobacter sp.]|uniref:gliding motility protein GldC n=1 Tax=Pseudopedobacter sp. TaxID=1936787 RepID=UPI00333F0D73
MRTAEIKLTVELDDKNIPENITWESTDGENQDALAVKSMMLGLWDPGYKNTLRIDLWTKDMPYDEMKVFFCQNLLQMGDSFLRASGGDPMAEKLIADLKDYCEHFSEKMDIMNK